MKKILLLAIAAVFALTSCQDFLDSENYTGANSGNFPTNVNDLNKEISALYGVMNQISTSPLENPYFFNILMGDEVNGAGGDGDTESHAVGHLMATKQDYFVDTYKAIYVGIARASAVIYTDESVLASLDETAKNQLLGEAHFMRGLFYLWAVQSWGDVPAYWAVSAPDPCPQQSAEDVVMPRIIEDFKEAYDLMSYNATTQGDGHATKGAAAGFLARAYMFYEGFYKKAGELATASPAPVTVEETGFSISKADVVACLENAISSGKYSLVSDFRQLWQYTNQYTAADYSYVSDLNANKAYWAGNGNTEEMFGIQYGNVASWNGTIGMGFTNQVELYVGLRCDDAADGHADAYGATFNGGSATFPFAQGWGQGTINANAYDEWSDNDPRKSATVADVTTECSDYKFTTSCTEDAGLYNKKIIGITTKETALIGDANTMSAGPYTWWDVVRTSTDGAGDCSNGNCMQGSHYSDAVLMRYADILLMHSELTGDATNLNKVRARAGLPSTTYSLANIQSERRWEFFGEGLRFNDLRRWSGKNGGSTCLAATSLNKQSGAKVNYQGRWTTMHHASSSWAQRYAETDGFLPIPSSQINVVNDPSILKQNAGWGDDVSDWNMTASPVY